MRILSFIALLLLPFLGAAQSASKPSVRVLPNPVSRAFVLQVHSPQPLSYTAELMDLTGHAVRATEPQTLTDQWEEHRVDVQDLPRGIYFCRVTFDNGEVQTLRVLLE